MIQLWKTEEVFLCTQNINVTIYPMKYGHADGMPVRVRITSGTVADCKQAIALIDGLFADYLLGDKGYDT